MFVLNSTAKQPAGFKEAEKILLLIPPGFANSTASGYDNDIVPWRESFGAEPYYLSYLPADAVSFNRTPKLFSRRYTDPRLRYTVLTVIDRKHSGNTFFASVIEPLKVSVVPKDCCFHRLITA